MELRKLSLILCSCVFAAAIAACGDNSGTTTGTGGTGTGTTGPAERAGRAVDNAGTRATDAAGNAATRAGEGIHSATQPGTTTTTGPGAMLDRAGDKTSDMASRTGGAIRAAGENIKDTAKAGTESGGQNIGNDEAAEKLIQQAEASLTKNDVTEARAFLTQLKDPRIHDHLSQKMKDQVAKLEKRIDDKASTAQEK